jgi:hypothetical protein
VTLPKNADYTPWEDFAKALLVTEMRQRRMSYKQLSKCLETYGIDEQPDRLNRKVNRKRFSAAFLLACLAAMKVDSITVSEPLADEGYDYIDDEDDDTTGI